MTLIPPNPMQPISSNGFMSQQYRTWTQEVSQFSKPIIGTGSPEGVIEAVQGQEYMDDTGTAGAIKYIKRDNDVAGDRKKGWILV